MKKIILFELNEVPWTILNYFSNKYENSVLSNILKNSKKIETFTEDRTDHLHPWMTWPSLHRGVINKKHGIEEFGQNLNDVDKEFPPIWKILADHNINVGIFGSLHSYHSFPEDLTNYSFYFPDTFAAGSECFPKKLESFQNFNLKMVSKSNMNVTKQIDWLPALNFLIQSPFLGINLSTFNSIGKQLISEKIDSWKKCRRRTLQVSLAFDIFFQQLNQKKPDFCTFFTNHVASSMHRFWGACFSEDYQKKFNFDLDSNYINFYKNEIDFTMLTLDNYLNKIVKFIDKNPEYQLWITSSMGQDGVPPKLGMLAIMIDDYDKFFNFFGIDYQKDVKQLPAMYPEYNFFIDHLTPHIIDKFKSISINNKGLILNQKENNFFGISFYDLWYISDKDVSVFYKNKQCDLHQLGLKLIKRDDSKYQTGYHVPNGSLFIYPSLKINKTPEKKSNLEIVPDILENYNIKKPTYMK